MKDSTRTPHSTSGTISASCWPSRRMRPRARAPTRIEEHIFSEKYLLERPLLAAIRREKPPVLLVDEVDRADEEFEAFLLELLSDFQVSIPELGTIAATVDPARGADLQRHARALGRAAPPLPLSLCRLSRRRARGADHPVRSCPASTAPWRSRSRAWWRRSARRTCARCPASPRRWTGRRHWPASPCMTCAQEPEAVHETLICLLKTHEDRSPRDPRSDRAPAGQGGVGEPPMQADIQQRTTAQIGDALRQRLAGFVRTLRDNGFRRRAGRDARCAGDPGLARWRRGRHRCRPALQRAVLRHPCRLGQVSTRSSTPIGSDAA